MVIPAMVVAGVAMLKYKSCIPPSFIPHLFAFFPHPPPPLTVQTLSCPPQALYIIHNVLRCFYFVLVVTSIRSCSDCLSDSSRRPQWRIRVQSGRYRTLVLSIIARPSRLILSSSLPMLETKSPSTSTRRTTQPLSLHLPIHVVPRLVVLTLDCTPITFLYSCSP
jgi:hypothetical protein